MLTGETCRRNLQWSSHEYHSFRNTRREKMSKPDATISLLFSKIISGTHVGASGARCCPGSLSAAVMIPCLPDPPHSEPKARNLPGNSTTNTTLAHTSQSYEDLQHWQMKETQDPWNKQNFQLTVDLRSTYLPLRVLCAHKISRNLCENLRCSNRKYWDRCATKRTLIWRGIFSYEQLLQYVLMGFRQRDIRFAAG